MQGTLMGMKLTVWLSWACLVLLAVPSFARAHIRMTAPTPRYGSDSLKVGPCGQAGGTRSEHVTTLRPGATLHVEWDETVQHDSHYRISFDPDGDDDFADPPEMQAYDSNDAVLLDAIPNEGGPHFAMDVTLPDLECERCTLQLIQVMYDKPPYEVGGNDIYYQCADLVLSRTAPEGSTGGAPDSDDGESGCSLGSQYTAGSALFIALALLVLRRRGVT
jgi:hypothetical protein